MAESSVVLSINWVTMTGPYRCIGIPIQLPEEKTISGGMIGRNYIIYQKICMQMR